MSEENLELSPKDAQAYIKATPGLQLIDVRNASEFREGFIAGAVLMPVNTLPARVQDIDKAKPVLLYCAKGGRSSMALDFLLDQGFSAKHIGGGIGDWLAEGLPIAQA